MILEKNKYHCSGKRLTICPLAPRLTESFAKHTAVTHISAVVDECRVIGVGNGRDLNLLHVIIRVPTV